MKTLPNINLLIKLVWIPMFLVGASLCVNGLLWLFVSEPWLLDQGANEILLHTTYDALFESTINQHLPDYLTGLYRFLGLWIFLIGFLMLIYMRATLLNNIYVRNYLYFFLVLATVCLYYLQYKFIPSTPYLWTSHSIVLALLVSMTTSQKLAKADA